MSGCRRCGCQGVARDTVVRRLAHAPFGWRPTTLLVTVGRYRCSGCGHVWRQDTSKAAEPRARVSRSGLAWALVGIVVQHLSVARVAEGLAVSWNTANDAVLAEGKRVLIDDPHRLEGVQVVGVDEQCWRHTRKGDKFVTVIIDLTPVRDQSGPARLLDMVEGRSKKAFKDWLGQQDQAFCEGIEVVAMDGFTGCADVVVMPTLEVSPRGDRDRPPIFGIVTGPGARTAAGRRGGSRRRGCRVGGCVLELCA